MDTTTEDSPKLSINQLRQAKIVCLAASGKRISHIAKEEGLSREWVGQIINRPEHQQLFYEIFEETRDEITSRMPDLINHAMNLLEKQLTTVSGYDNPARMQAATKLLEMTLKYTQPPHNPCTNCKCCGNNLTTAKEG